MLYATFGMCSRVLGFLGGPLPGGSLNMFHLPGPHFWCPMAEILLDVFFFTKFKYYVRLELVNALVKVRATSKSKENIHVV